MKGAPNWRKSGDSVDGVWKESLIPWLGKICGLQTLIETGTCQGSMIVACQPHFNQIYSAELSESYYRHSLKRVGHFLNVHLYWGDSRDMLPKMILDAPDEPLLFWLDAHPSGIGGCGPTADAGNPLAEEIQLINRDRPDSLVVVDDLPDGDFYFGDDSEGTLVWREILDGWTRDYRTGELILHRGGYSIPPFED